MGQRFKWMLEGGGLPPVEVEAWSVPGWLDRLLLRLLGVRYFKAWL